MPRKKSKKKAKKKSFGKVFGNISGVSIGGPITVCVGKGKKKKCYPRQYGGSTPTAKKGKSTYAKPAKPKKRVAKSAKLKAAQKRLASAAKKCKGLSKSKFRTCMKQTLKGKKVTKKVAKKKTAKRGKKK